MRTNCHRCEAKLDRQWFPIHGTASGTLQLACKSCGFVLEEKWTNQELDVAMNELPLAENPPPETDLQRQLRQMNDWLRATTIARESSFPLMPRAKEEPPQQRRVIVFKYEDGNARSLACATHAAMILNEELNDGTVCICVPSSIDVQEPTRVEPTVFYYPDDGRKSPLPGPGDAERIVMRHEPVDGYTAAKMAVPVLHSLSSPEYAVSSLNTFPGGNYLGRINGDVNIVALRDSLGYAPPRATIGTPSIADPDDPLPTIIEAKP